MGFLSPDSLPRSVTVRMPMKRRKRNQRVKEKGKGHSLQNQRTRRSNNLHTILGQPSISASVERYSHHSHSECATRLDQCRIYRSVPGVHKCDNRGVLFIFFARCRCHASQTPEGTGRRDQLGTLPTRLSRYTSHDSSHGVQYRRNFLLFLANFSQDGQREYELCESNIWGIRDICSHILAGAWAKGVHRANN